MIWAAVRDDQKWFYANKSYFVTEPAAANQSDDDGEAAIFSWEIEFVKFQTVSSRK